ncbi:MAG: hypothetical protein Q9179_007474, partial [Wetmoreana sp. 5 TL-2023]
PNVNNPDPARCQQVNICSPPSSLLTASVPKINNTFGNIICGFLRSDNVIRYISDIPCDIIQTLESDADQAKDFVNQLQQGHVPTLIENLAEEALGDFKNVIGIFVTLPSEIVGAAAAAVTDAAHIFNDIGHGTIISDIENLPGVRVSDVTSAWGDFTVGL